MDNDRHFCAHFFQHSQGFTTFHHVIFANDFDEIDWHVSFEEVGIVRPAQPQAKAGKWWDQIHE